MSTWRVVVALAIGLGLYLAFRIVVALAVRGLRALLPPNAVKPVVTPLGSSLLAATFLLWLHLTGAQDDTAALLGAAGFEFLKVALTWLSAHVATLLVARLYFERIRGIPLPGVVQRVLVSVLFVVGMLALLQARFEWSAGDLVLLTSLVALSCGVVFQSALGELLASVSLGLSDTLRVGDLVRVGDTEGWIEEIEARTTVLRGFDGGHVMIANRKLIESRVVNYSRPERAHPARFTLAASASAPPNAVKASLAQCAALAPGVRSEPAPEVVQVGAEGGAVHYRVTFWVDDYAGRHTAEDAIRTLAWYRLRRDGHGWPAADDAHVDRAAAAALLAAVPILAALTPDETAALASRAQVVLYGAGESLFREGDAGESLFVLRSGGVRLSVATAGQKGEAEIGAVAPGGSFGERSLLTGAKRSAHATAAVDSELLRIDRESFRAIVLSNPEIVGRLTDIVAEQDAQNQARRNEQERLDAGRLASERQTIFERIREFLN